MFPKGFKAGGIHSGIKKKNNVKDLAIFISEFPTSAAAMFTENLVKAAPVLVSQSHMKKTVNRARAIVANSGNANACTGFRGTKDAEGMCSAVAAKLGLPANEVLVASTGVIGQYLPIDKIKKGISSAASALGSDAQSFQAAAQAIMTTDTFVKTAQRTVSFGKKTVTIWGCAKGSGMIHPVLAVPHATMLSFILTDAAISPEILERALHHAVEYSFNCVTVDGDTSTNDTVIALANGAAENPKILNQDRQYHLFTEALSELCLELAKMVAKDGEGATCLVEIDVRNASDEHAARKVASTIATSPLVKTAIFGRDANWGRIIGAAGRAGVPIRPELVDITIGGMPVCRKGLAVNFNESRAKKLLSQKEVKIVVDLHLGRSSASYYTCDFSFDYIKINASYRS